MPRPKNSPTLAKLLAGAKTTREAFALDGLRAQETAMYRNDYRVDLEAGAAARGILEETLQPKFCIWCHERHVEYLTCTEAANVEG